MILPTLSIEWNENNRKDPLFRHVKKTRGKYLKLDEVRNLRNRFALVE